MRKNTVRSISVHIEDGTDLTVLADTVSELHADIIERKLKEAGLSAKQKTEVIDRIIENLREANGLTE